MLDPALDSAITRAEELAKRWTIALIGARPLDALASVPLEELAREAPSLCAQALRAVQSDVELERLTGRGATTGREDSAAARSLAAVAGAHDGAAAVEAVEALRGVLWETLLDELSAPSTRQLADISDRLAYVCACALAATIAAALTPAPDASDAADASSVSTSVARDASATHAVGAAQSPLPAAVIVDEHAGVQLAPARHGVSAPSPAPASAIRMPAARDPHARERPLSWDESPPVAPASRVSPAVPAPSEEIEIRDERGEEGPAAWIGSIGRQVTRFEEDGHPFAVLLVELLDLDRIRALEASAELVRLAGQVQEVLAAELRPLGSGSLTRESTGRYWLLAPETDRLGAGRLADRLATAVAASLSYRGGPLEVVIGVAVGPDDGLPAPALAAHADVDLYAARSSARHTRGRTTTPIIDESA